MNESEITYNRRWEKDDFYIEIREHIAVCTIKSNDQKFKDTFTNYRDAHTKLECSKMIDKSSQWADDNDYKRAEPLKY